MQTRERIDKSGAVKAKGTKDGEKTDNRHEIKDECIRWSNKSLVLGSTAGALAIGTSSKARISRGGGGGIGSGSSSSGSLSSNSNISAMS